MTTNTSITIQITPNITLSLEGYEEFSATLRWWEKEKSHSCGTLHWSGNEYFIPTLVEYYREHESPEWVKVKEWALSHNWFFQKYGDQYHLVSVERVPNPKVQVEDPKTEEIIEEYKTSSVKWEALRDFCLPVVINFK